MDNRNHRLRVQNKKPIKRSGKKPLVKKFLDYLKSDTFLYAPLLSPQPSGSGFPSPNNFKVVELKRPIKERHWFNEYLKSQGYMYDPVIELPLSPQEPLKDREMIRKDVSTGKSTMNVNNQQTDDLENLNKRSESHIPQTHISDRVTQGQKETVKHTVYQTCRTTSTSRNMTLNAQLRAHS
ncbi:hypothetical protein MtrunA17_Chr4g0073221 [Medicago truncatula]|uniref:Uncharacterized protein n=1 Tax=Medicago truncatula TaxID=3880 RepID=A0A072URZ2_MEDTR|nr:uncharacterized protein LOC25494263 isoform X1 [Medicago truncatula]KEH32579.1 hypothetical protein MTR_4g129620 [Medicago truncatula]RHN64818.1 hypothetical protein MtrunA17_Chr4g0073221 [Medicago truncatula]